MARPIVRRNGAMRFDVSHEANAAPLPAAPHLPRNRQFLILAVIAAALALVGIAVVAIRSLGAHPPAAERGDPPGVFRPTPEQRAQLKIEPVRSGGSAAMLDAIGTITVDGNHSTPVVLPYSGQVAEVYVEAGQRVARGQPLLRIASADLVDARNALMTAEAQHSTATAQLAIARANAQRQEAIFRSAGGAEKDYRQAQADLVAAQSALRTADAARAAARNKLALWGHGGTGGASVIYRAPVAGTIATRDVAPGQYIGAGGDKPLLTIADLNHVWLVAQLPESQAATIHKGDALTVTTPALSGRTFSAVVDNVAAALDPVTRRLAVRATVNNPDGALKPQMSASFAIRTREDAARGIFVPSAAVIHEGDSARVWVARADGTIVGRAVTIGETAGGYTRILSGLAPQEKVVTGGALFVNEAGIGG